MADISVLEAREARYREIISRFTLMSDAFMRTVFKDKRCTEHLLQVIMDDESIKVMEQTIQKDYKNLQGRSAVLDCEAIDGSGRIFDVEIQQEGEEASPKRARYYSGLMDMNNLNAGDNFDLLPETYVIFITSNDVLGHGEPIYHIEKQIKEVQCDFGDGARIIYADASRRDGTKLGRLMHDLNCLHSKDMYSPILAERVRKFKETEKGVEYMCKELRELYNDGVAEGKAEGELEKAKKATIKLAAKKTPIPEIADILEVSTEQVEVWLGLKKTVV